MKPVPAAPRAELQALSDADLLARFAAAQQGVLGFMRQALLYARDAGEILAEFKRRQGYGRWLLWLKDHDISPSTAANYVRVFERWAEIEPRLQEDASFTLSDAVALLAAPRKPRPDPEKQFELPGGDFYMVPVVEDWLVLLETMPVPHIERCRASLERLHAATGALLPKVAK